MEIIRGKHTSFINAATLAEQIRAFDAVHIDIGTGDGRFVQHSAQIHPSRFVIGIDACRENLHEVSRRASSNALFVIANAQALPSELHSLADHVTINFPWGSLVEGLLENDAALMASLAAVLRPNATLEVRLNGGALSEAGWSLEAGADRVQDVLAVNGFNVRQHAILHASELKSIPTTWAKRLAFGRDPRAVYLKAIKRVNTLNVAA
jgi:predicted RNA methylase